MSAEEGSNNEVASAAPATPGVIPILPARPFKAEAGDVAELRVSPISFKGLVEAAQAAGERNEKFGEALFHEQFARQVKAFDAKGAEIALTALDFLSMPIAYARQAALQLSGPATKPGRIVKDGDGIESPCRFELGTPIPLRKGRIAELEFKAATLGDVAPIYAAAGRLERALILIERLAVPVMVDTDATSLRLPSWALPLISVQDGTAIMESVLPRFL